MNRLDKDLVQNFDREERHLDLYQDNMNRRDMEPEHLLPRGQKLDNNFLLRTVSLQEEMYFESCKILHPEYMCLMLVLMKYLLDK